MSLLRVTNIENRTGADKVIFPFGIGVTNGVICSGVITATGGFVGSGVSLTGVKGSIDATGGVGNVDTITGITTIFVGAGLSFTESRTGIVSITSLVAPGQDLDPRNVNVSGAATVGGALDVNGGADISGGETVLSSATVSDLTEGRVVLAGASGALVDNGNLRFGANGLTVTGQLSVSGVTTSTGGFEGDLTGNVTGDLTGNADTATTATDATNADNIDISATSSTDVTTSVVLVANQATGNQAPFIDSGLTYNANTNALNATNFVGDLTGNADTATSATNATNATNSTNINPAGETSEATAFPVFVNSATGNQQPKTNTNLKFNASNNTLETAQINATSGFGGNINGNVTGGITTTGDSTIAFLNATNVNISGILTAGTFTLNNLTGNVTGNINSAGVSTIAFLQATTVNATGIITASSFTGNLTGNADTATLATNATDAVFAEVSTYAGIATAITLVSTNDTDASHFIIFSDSNTGNENPRTDSSLTYNPSTNVLTAGSVTGNLTGNVTGNVTGDVTGNADTATTATNANNINIVTDDSTAADHFVVFAGSNSGNQIPNASSDLKWNPNTNTLTASVADIDTITGAITFDNTVAIQNTLTTRNILPDGNGTRDIGATGTRYANVYTSDIDLDNKQRGGNDIDGTWGSYLIQEGEDDLFIINRRNGKKYKFNLTEV